MRIENFDDMAEIYLPSGSTLAVSKVDGGLSLEYKRKQEKTRTVERTKPFSQSREDDVTATMKLNLPPLLLRIANGGGGQAGLVEALALRYLEEVCPTIDGIPAAIGWRATNTGGSLKGLHDGIVDVAIVYEIEREMEALVGSGPLGKYASRVQHVWMDHFNIIGPADNPADIKPTDTVDTALQKIMLAPGALWLTRDDMSAINCKEGPRILELVNRRRAEAGTEPTTADALKRDGRAAAAAESALASACAHYVKAAAHGDEAAAADAEAEMRRAAAAYAESMSAADGVCKRGFYRVERLMPLQATRRAAELGYYTMSDNGIYNCLSAEERRRCVVFVDGRDPRHQPDLLNPADALLGVAPSPAAAAFVRWLRGPTAQATIRDFAGAAAAAAAAAAPREPLYRPADPAYVRDRAKRQAEAARASSSPPAPPLAKAARADDRAAGCTA